MSAVDLQQGDCLELMKNIPSGSVDLVLADPPYGTIKGAGFDYWNAETTAWDDVIEPTKMFKELNRVLRPNGKAVIFAQEPYTTQLIVSAVPSLPFAYRAIWYKNVHANALLAKKAMVSRYEDICIFSKVAPKHDFGGGNPLRDYFRALLAYIGAGDWKRGRREVLAALGGRADHTTRVNSTQFTLCTELLYKELTARFTLEAWPEYRQYTDLRAQEDEYRTALIERMNTEAPSVFNLWQGNKSKSNVLEYAKDNDRYHPTQKPVKLLEDLIQTYSNPGDTVLDFAMGSGSTGVACVNTGRDFIGMELDAGCFQSAKERIEKAAKLIAAIKEVAIV